MDNGLTYRCVTYVGGSPKQLWAALTDPELTLQFWGHRNVSDWRLGSRWQHLREDGTVDGAGVVLRVAPPAHLTFTFASPADPDPASASLVAFMIEPWEGIVRLTVRQANIPDYEEYLEVERAWPAILANLKTLVETGQPLPRAPWEMPAEVIDSHR